MCYFNNACVYHLVNHLIFILSVSISHLKIKMTKLFICIVAICVYIQQVNQMIRFVLFFIVIKFFIRQYQFPIHSDMFSCTEYIFRCRHPRNSYWFRRIARYAHKSDREHCDYLEKIRRQSSKCFSIVLNFDFHVWTKVKTTFIYRWLSYSIWHCKVIHVLKMPSIWNISSA